MEMRHLLQAERNMAEPPIPPPGEAAASRDPGPIDVRHSQSTFMGANFMALDLLTDMARSLSISTGACSCSPWK